ncbi:hypothetical protein [Devosia pacifica]|uniref:hypothetical protein n=1 Tax=Devosia pacifica TaxID=1335967 RepID=UPI001674434B|nr:hypothetical protein [Devosia pacifica]
MRRLTLSLALIAAVSALPASSQEVPSPPLSEVGSDLVFSALDHQLVLPAPQWWSAGQAPITERFDVKVTADTRQALVEVSPLETEDQDIVALFAARLTLEPQRSLREYRRTVMLSYAQLCQPDLTGFFQLSADDGETLAPLGFVCGLFADRLPSLAGLGEIVIMTFRQSDQGVAVVYEEWMGPAFDPGNISTWPVSAETVELRADALASRVQLLLAGD